MVQLIMVEKSVNPMPFESASIIPSLTAVQYTPDLRESTPTPLLPLLSIETCIGLWSTESKVFFQFNLYILYELQRIFLLWLESSLKSCSLMSNFTLCGNVV